MGWQCAAIGNKAAVGKIWHVVSLAGECEMDRGHAIFARNICLEMEAYQEAEFERKQGTDRGLEKDNMTSTNP